MLFLLKIFFESHLGSKEKQRCFQYSVVWGRVVSGFQCISVSKSASHFTDMFKMYCFLPSLSSQFQVPAESGKNALSFCNLPKQLCIHSHVTCQVSVKVNPQPWRVFVYGVGVVEGRSGLWLTHMLPCSGQWPKPHGHSDMINEINTGQMWDVS